MDKGLTRVGVHTWVFSYERQIQVPTYTSYYMGFWNLEAIYLLQIIKTSDLYISQKKKPNPNLSYDL